MSLRMSSQSTITSWPHSLPSNHNDSLDKPPFVYRTSMQTLRMSSQSTITSWPHSFPSNHNDSLDKPPFVYRTSMQTLRMSSHSTITSWPHSLPSNHNDSLDKPPYVYRTSMQTLRMSSQGIITSWPHSLPSNHNDNLDKPPYVYRTSMQTLIARRPTTVWFTAWLQLYLKYNHTICYIGWMALGLVEWQPAWIADGKVLETSASYHQPLFHSTHMQENFQGFTWFQVFCQWQNTWPWLKKKLIHS